MIDFIVINILKKIHNLSVQIVRIFKELMSEIFCHLLLTCINYVTYLSNKAFHIVMVY